MPKGRRWRVLQQTCNMTPCSPYRSTGHSSTSSTSRPLPAGSDTSARSGRDDPVPPTAPAAPDTIPTGKVIQGKRVPSSTKVAALGHLLGREPQALQGPGKSRRTSRRTHHRSIPWYNFMATPHPFRTHANTHSAPIIPHEDGPPPHRIRETPQTPPEQSFRRREDYSRAPAAAFGGPLPTPPRRRLPGPFDPAPADLVHMPPAAPTDTGADPAPRPPSGAPPTDRQPRGRRPFRRPGKDR